jgi:glycerol dehydrogenase
MSAINVPKFYENSRGIIKNSGDYIKKLGENALIVGGNTALKIVGESLFSSLDKNGITYETIIFTGYPTLEKLEQLSGKAVNNDVIIGVGGGKVLDLVKAIGNKVNIPVVTIPTIPATCAAWSALSVIYTDKGEQDIYIHLDESPNLIIADKDILAEAPIRYINSGVADSIVKWYEISPDLRNNEYDFCLRLQVKVCELALEFLKEDYIEAYKNGELFKNKDNHFINNAIDSIIMLAGLSGSINGSVPYGGLAHPFYNSSTYVYETHKLLHGEKVIFGLLVQLILEKRSDKEINEFIKWIQLLGLPTTLEELGIVDNVEENVYIIAKKIKESVGSYSGLDYELKVEQIVAAIFEVNKKGKIR